MGKYKRGTTLYDYCISEDKKWILEQFDDEKNAPLTTKDFSKSSDTYAWFKFKECGHSCKQRIADKTGKNSKKCPTCLNRNGIGKSLSSLFHRVLQKCLCPQKMAFLQIWCLIKMAKFIGGNVLAVETNLRVKLRTLLMVSEYVMNVQIKNVLIRNIAYHITCYK